ncbi:MAG: hypothetical protein ABMA64_24275 [Myxococcota bacterium]
MLACDARAIPALERVLRELFQGVPLRPDQVPEGALLLEITWQDAGAAPTVTRLYADGTQTAGDVPERRLRPETLATLRAALAAVDVAGLTCP